MNESTSDSKSSTWPVRTPPHFRVPFLSPRSGLCFSTSAYGVVHATLNLSSGELLGSCWAKGGALTPKGQWGRGWML